MNENNRQSIIQGVERLSQAIIKIAGALVGLTCFAYIIGWLYANGYYKSIGAKWLIDELPITSIIGLSWKPVSIFAFLISIGIIELANSEDRIEIKETNLFKLSGAILRHGLYVYLFLIFLHVIIIYFTITNIVFRIIISSLMLFMLLFTTQSAFYGLAVKLRDPQTKSDTQSFVLIFIFIIFGLYLFPAKWGEIDALVNKDNNRSRLPIVILNDEPNMKYFLLYAKESRFYLFSTESTDEFPLIKIANENKIKSIQRKR